MKQARITDFPELPYLWQVDNLYLAGQPSANSLKAFADKGIKKIINIRAQEEMDFSPEEQLCTQLGMEYIQVPIMQNGELSADNCKKLNGLIDDTTDVVVHCGTANRVAGWLITYLVEKKQLDFEAAVDVASNNGLASPALIPQAQKVLGL